MPILVEEVNDSVHCVKWKVVFANTVTSGKTNKTIQIARFSACFDIECTYSEINSADRSYNVKFSLMQMGRTNKGSNSNENREAIPDYYREPFAVSIVHKKDQKHMFKRKSDGWKINTTLKKSSSGYIFAMINIQFHTFSEISDLLVQLTEIYLNQSNCNVQFCFKDDQKIGGHISILAARSPVFAAMFNHDMQEKKTREVFIEDIQLDIFKELLHYIYSGRTETIMTGDIARLLLEAADKYDIPGLKEECIRILLINLQESNALELLVWADMHSVEKVKKGTLNYLAKNFKTICQMEDWEAFILNYPHLSLLITRHFGSIK